MVEGGFTYLCLTDEQNKRRLPFLFLSDMKERFLATYGERARTAVAFAMQADFSRVLSDRMAYFNDNPNADSFGKVRGQIADVKEVMVENIEKVLARGEKIELLVEKSEQLSRAAGLFNKKSKALSNFMWCNNVKMWVLIAFILAILAWLISSFVCGFNYEKCASK
jgi:vesicle-associated membrane protein 7